jgi:uncharacterized protein (UPF0332 family)
MKEELGAFLEKARESIKGAEVLLAQGLFGFAASRAYYAMSYVAEALLLSKGLSFSKHGQVLAAFGEHFAKPKVLDPKYHRYLLEGYEQRQIGDYEPLEKVSKGAAESLIEKAREFLAEAKEYLEKS